MRGDRNRSCSLHQYFCQDGSLETEIWWTDSREVGEQALSATIAATMSDDEHLCTGNAASEKRGSCTGMITQLLVIYIFAGISNADSSSLSFLQHCAFD